MSKSTEAVPVRQFRLRSFFAAVTLVAFFLAGRKLLPGPPETFLFRAYAVSLSTALVFTVWRSLSLPSTGLAVLGTTLVTGIVAAICGAIIGVEVAEDLRRIGYFNWSEGWSLILFHVSTLGVLGTIFGFMTVSLILTVRQRLERHGP